MSTIAKQYSSASPNIYDEFLLIIDYNLSRIAEVAEIASYAAQEYNLLTILVKHRPSFIDSEVASIIIDADPRSKSFVDSSLAALAGLVRQIKYGIVFSDDAVYSGAQLLEALGLQTDAAALADAAYDKGIYRDREHNNRILLDAQRYRRVDAVRVFSANDVRRRVQINQCGVVIKPAREGNNRGVAIVRGGDEINKAWNNVKEYLTQGIIAEDYIPFSREYSFDGVGHLSFITEKISSSGQYPVEIAQVVPAILSNQERVTLNNVGTLANYLVGQQTGPFHNEIKLSDDGLLASVVEVNRRPAGMRIWPLAELVYGLSIHRLWVDSLTQRAPLAALPCAKGRAAYCALPWPSNINFDAAWFWAHADASIKKCIKAVTTKDRVTLVASHVINERPISCPEIPRTNADFPAGVTLITKDLQFPFKKWIGEFISEWIRHINAELARRLDRSNSRPMISAQS